MNESLTFVRGLIEQAGLRLNNDEIAELASSYELHRAAVETLYSVPMTKEEEPQVIFSPLHHINAVERGAS